MDINKWGIAFAKEAIVQKPERTDIGTVQWRSGMNMYDGKKMTVYHRFNGYVEFVESGCFFDNCWLEFIVPENIEKLVLHMFNNDVKMIELIESCGDVSTYNKQYSGESVADSIKRWAAQQIGKAFEDDIKKRNLTKFFDISSYGVTVFNGVVEIDNKEVLKRIYGDKFDSAIKKWEKLGYYLV